MSIEIPATKERTKRPPRSVVSWRNDPTRIVGEMTPEEYHAFVGNAGEKYEFIKGKVVKMPGANFQHNPTLIVEVLSPSTAAVDEGDKFRDYRSIPSLQHYIMVTQDAPFVTHYARIDNGYWSIIGDYTDLKDALTLSLDGTNIRIPLSRIYRRAALSDAIFADAAE